MTDRWATFFFLLMGKLYFYSENWQVNFCFFSHFQSWRRIWKDFMKQTFRLQYSQYTLFFDPPEECV